MNSKQSEPKIDSESLSRENKNKVIEISISGDNASDSKIQSNKQKKISQQSSRTQKSKTPNQSINQNSAQGEINQNFSEKKSLMKSPESKNLNKEIEDNDVQLNNFMAKQETFDHEKKGSCNLIRMSQHEVEEDFLKANSSKPETDKASQLTKEIENSNLGISNQPNHNLEISNETSEDAMIKKFKEDNRDNGKKYLNEDEMEYQREQYHEQRMMNREDKDEDEDDDDEDEDEEEMGLIAEPEAVDVSVCTENLEEFDHDESPQEYCDSDEDEYDDDEND